jgi:hypothetical protein
MLFSSLWALLLALFASTISATALTYKLQPNEKACFFAEVKQRQSKIAFYFAVRISSPLYWLSVSAFPIFCVFRT